MIENNSYDKAANADHYPRAAGSILGTTTTTTLSLVDSAALRGSQVKSAIL